MVVMYKFTVYGEPRGKGRPRFFRNRAYTDKATAEYESRVRKAWKLEEHPYLAKQPTTVIVNAFFPVPVSLSKKKREAMFGAPCLRKPDGDNIGKIILDALNILAFEDDSQIDTLRVVKRYVSGDDDRPRVEVEIIGGETK